MNVFPNDVAMSSAPLPSPTGEGKERHSSTLGGDNRSSSAADDGDLRKLSGGTALSESGPVILKETMDVAKSPPQINEKSSHNPAGDKSDGLKKRRSRKKWKKPKDKPSRPLSAYNLFFQAERAVMLGDDVKATDQDKGQKRIHRKTHGKIGFADMARNIGQKWKDLPEDEKKPFTELASKEKVRYVRELQAWKAEQALIKPTKSLAATLKAEAAELDSRDVQEIKSAIQRTNSNKATATATAAARGAELEIMTDELHFQKMALLKKQQQQQQIEEDYIRALQERRMAIFAGRVGRDSSIYQQYPSAAEASANALLSQYQPGSLGGMNPMGFALGPMAMNTRGMNNMGMNNMGMNNMGMNNMGINSMGMNNIGMNNIGMNNMGMNNMGMNMGMSRNSLAASMNIMNPPDLQQQLGANRLQQQLRAGLGRQALNETQSAQNPNSGANTAADMARMDELSSQIRKNMNGRLSF